LIASFFLPVFFIGVFLLPVVCFDFVCFFLAFFLAAIGAISSQPLLIFKQKIVHLPEFTVSSSELSSLRGRFGMRVHLAQPKIPEHEHKTLSKMLLNALDNSVGAATIGTLVIFILK
jgi:hypothetical protein